MSRVTRVAITSLALVLAGCGTAGSAGIGGGASTPATSATIGPPVQRSPTKPPAPTSSTTPLGNVLTAADDGATVTLVVGERLTVSLAPVAGAYAWDRPRLSGSALRLVATTGGYPSAGLVQALFLAISPGTATVSTVSDMPCLHAQPRCLVAQRLWTSYVIVRSRP